MDTTVVSDVEHVVDAAEQVLGALLELHSAIGDTTSVARALRGHGDRSLDELGRPPYECRNLLADLEGVAGGWLMSRGESFVESVQKLRAWLLESESEIEYDD